MTTRPVVEETQDGLSVVRFPPVSVCWDLDYGEALRQGAPETDPVNLIGELGEAYRAPSGKTGVEQVEMSLLGLHGVEARIRYVHSLACERRNTVVGTFRHMLALGKAFPSLPADLEMSFLKMVCLQSCNRGGIQRWPVLTQCDGRREGGTAHKDSVFAAHCFFLALGRVE